MTGIRFVDGSRWNTHFLQELQSEKVRDGPRVQPIHPDRLFWDKLWTAGNGEECRMEWVVSGRLGGLVISGVQVYE